MSARRFGGDIGGAHAVVRIGPAPAVRAEAAALAALGPLGLRGLVRPAGDGATTLVAGVPLDRWGPRPWPQVAAALAPVAEALAGIHAAGWVHGDVSPANVVVGADGAGVLVDLGCAAPHGAARSTGTPGFVAPEVAAGAPVTSPAEVFALGAVAAAALGPEPPAGAVLALRRAASPDPDDRPTAAQLAAVLALAAGAAPEAGAGDDRSATTRDYGPRPPAPPEPAAGRRRRPLLAAAAIGAAAVVGTGVAVARAEASPPPPGCPPLPPTATLAGDVDGDGCDEAATWSGGVLTVALEAGAEPSRIAVGAPGDVVTLGDWDCDGVDTPAAYRPGTGVVTVWNAWPSTRRPVPPGGATAAGCDRVPVGPDR